MATTRTTRRRVTDAPTLALAISDIIRARAGSTLSARAENALRDIIAKIVTSLAGNPRLGINLTFNNEGTQVSYGGRVQMSRLHLMVPEDQHCILAVGPVAIAQSGIVLWSKPHGA